MSENNACITAFEDYFQGDWNDPYFKEQRLNWEAAWDAAIGCKKVSKPLFTEMIAQHQGLSEELKERDNNPWRAAVEEELLLILDEMHSDPCKAVKDAIKWNVKLALDPLVSKEAQALIEKGKDQVLEQSQEPVCYLWVDPVTLNYEVDHCNHPGNELIPVYLAPQNNNRPMADDQWFKFWEECDAIPGDSIFPEFLEIARAIEAHITKGPGPAA